MTRRISHLEHRFEAVFLAGRVRHVRRREALDPPFAAHLLCDADISTADLAGVDATLTMTRHVASRTYRGEISRADVRAGSQGTVAFVRVESALVRLDRSPHHRVVQGMIPLARQRLAKAVAGRLLRANTARPTSRSSYVRRLLEDGRSSVSRSAPLPSCSTRIAPMWGQRSLGSTHLRARGEANDAQV